LADVLIDGSASVFRSQKPEKAPQPGAAITTVLDQTPWPKWAGSLDAAVRTLNSPELVAFLNSSSYRVGTELSAKYELETKAQQQNSRPRWQPPMCT
jgi:hypothetical protein